MIILARLGLFIARNWLLIAALISLAGFVIVHLVWYIHPSDISSNEDLAAALTDGQPTVVEVYTNL